LSIRSFRRFIRGDVGDEDGPARVQSGRFAAPGVLDHPFAERLGQDGGDHRTACGLGDPAGDLVRSWRA
jgi:hypothetical protein